MFFTSAPLFFPEIDGYMRRSREESQKILKNFFEIPFPNLLKVFYL